MEDKRSWTDEELIAAVAGKDHGAFRILVERYQGKVLSSIYRYGGDSNGAEDLAQDIFLKVYRSAGRYKPTAKFSTWLFKVVVNHCINHFQRTRKSRLDTAISEESIRNDCGGESLVEAKNPETSASEKERAFLLREAVDRLPGKQRMAILLQRFEGSSYAEISRIMGCSEKAVESLLQRALVSLRVFLEPHLLKRSEGFFPERGLN